MSKELDKLMSQAKIGVLYKHSHFLATIIYNLKCRYTEEITTAATDGMELLFNPNFFKSLTAEERTGLLAHEAMHVALLHSVRCGSKNQNIYNIAADHVINLMLLEQAYALPKGAYHDNNYRGMSTEKVYEILMQDPPKENPDLMDIIPGGGDSEDENKSSSKEIEAKTKELLIKAQTISKLNGEDPGNIPGEMQRLIDKLLNPQLPWESLLEKFITRRVKNDYSWKRPNRRYMPDLYLPGLYSEAIGTIACAIDTSGSVTKKELTELLSELTYIHQTIKPEKMVIMDCDYYIHNTYEITEADEIADLHFSGGGGTRFAPVFDELKDKDIECLIYFTDLHATPIKEQPPYDVLWICTGKHEPALIGETIYLK